MKSKTSVSKEKELPAKDIFKKSDGGENGTDKKTFPAIPTEMPSNKEFAEAHTPELSQDTFEIGGKTFQLRMSSIKTQKTMAMALDTITDLIKKIDLLPIFRGVQNRLNREREDMIAKIKKVENNKEEEKEDVVFNDSSSDYLDMVELIRDVVSHGGLGNIVGTILDLYVGVIWAICKSQDNAISRDWIEDNISFYNAQKIFFMQMQKDRIGGRVIDFLHMLTRQIVSTAT